MVLDAFAPQLLEGAQGGPLERRRENDDIRRRCGHGDLLRKDFLLQEIRDVESRFNGLSRREWVKIQLDPPTVLFSSAWNYA